MTTNVKITVPIKIPNGTIEIIEVVEFQTELEPHEVCTKLIKGRR